MNKKIERTCGQLFLLFGLIGLQACSKISTTLGTNKSLLLGGAGGNVTGSKIGLGESSDLAAASGALPAEAGAAKESAADESSQGLVALSFSQENPCFLSASGGQSSAASGVPSLKDDASFGAVAMKDAQGHELVFAADDRVSFAVCAASAGAGVGAATCPSAFMGTTSPFAVLPTAVPAAGATSVFFTGGKLLAGVEGVFYLVARVTHVKGGPVLQSDPVAVSLSKGSSGSEGGAACSQLPALTGEASGVLNWSADGKTNSVTVNVSHLDFLTAGGNAFDPRTFTLTGLDASGNVVERPSSVPFAALSNTSFQLTNLWMPSARASFLRISASNAQSLLLEVSVAPGVPVLAIRGLPPTMVQKGRVHGMVSTADAAGNPTQVVTGMTITEFSNATCTGTGINLSSSQGGSLEGLKLYVFGNTASPMVFGSVVPAVSVQVAVTSVSSGPLPQPICVAVGIVNEGLSLTRPPIVPEGQCAPVLTRSGSGGSAQASTFVAQMADFSGPTPVLASFFHGPATTATLMAYSDPLCTKAYQSLFSGANPTALIDPVTGQATFKSVTVTSIAASGPQDGQPVYLAAVPYPVTGLPTLTSPAAGKTLVVNGPDSATSGLPTSLSQGCIKVFLNEGCNASAPCCAVDE